MPDPRGVEQRLRWFLNNDPGWVGMCARHSWRALGGDQGNPPRWYAADANAVYDKVKASGRYFTSPPPRGALVLWEYGQHGHAALSMGGGKIATTDPTGKPGGTGVESLTYPHRWGANASARIWTDQYNGVRFPVAADGGDPVDIYDYKYSGKPAGALPVGQKYARLDVPEWDPPRAGLEHVLVYLNCSGFVFDGAKPGRIRLRLNRLDGDTTGHQDFVVVPGVDELLITHTYFEQGDGTSTAVDVRCLDGLQSMSVGTRYLKRAIVSDKG
jgi:hypothetical protein